MTNAKKSKVENGINNIFTVYKSTTGKEWIEIHKPTNVMYHPETQVATIEFTDRRKVAFCENSIFFINQKNGICMAWQKEGPKKLRTYVETFFGTDHVDVAQGILFDIEFSAVMPNFVSDE